MLEMHPDEYFVFSSVPIQRFIDMSIAMGENDATGLNAVETVLSAIRKLNAEIDIPVDLSELGAKDEDIKYYAEMALKDIADMTNPRQATLEDMIQLIRISMRMKSGQEKPEQELEEGRSINLVNAMLSNSSEKLGSNDSHVNMN